MPENILPIDTLYYHVKIIYFIDGFEYLVTQYIMTSDGVLGIV
jgi:hypothetical protein